MSSRSTEERIGCIPCRKGERQENGGGGEGVKCANITKKTGMVVGAKIMENNFDGDLIFSAKSGQVIRMSADAIPSRGRATQGVILMRLPEGDFVSGVTKIANVEGEESNAEDDDALRLIEE